ncbi:MAG TPA: hypothetical protein PLZ95_04415 [Bryobacteraceae bacterium]|nr:hypothetical protein [Bryobacteraceae bacterium]
MRFTQTCDPSWYPHSAVVFITIGIEGEPTPVEYCSTFTAPQGTQQAGVTYSLGFHLPTGTGVDCGNGTCHFNYNLRLLDANGNTLNQLSGYATPPVAATWTCYDDPESPPAKACYSTTPVVVDVSSLTANGPAELTLAASLGTEIGAWGVTQMEVAAAAGELVSLRTLKFDYEAGTNDAVGMKIDETTDIPEFEWQAGVRETPATEAAFTSETIAPAAYVSGQPLRVKAQFTGLYEYQGAVVKATITMADGSPSPYGELGQQTVSFDYDENFEWVSTPLVLTSTQSATAIAARDLKFNWQIVSVQYREDAYRTLPWWLAFPSSVGSRTTTHRIYTLYRAPVDSMAVPWAKALELSSGMMSTLTGSSTEESAVHLIADGIFYSRWTEYDTRFFKPVRHYGYNPSANCSCGSATAQLFNLSNVLSRLAATEWQWVELQCNDSSNFHAILASSQGITARPTYIYDTRGIQLQPTALYSRAGIGLCSTGCWIDQFNYHQVASLGEPLYDTSARSATGSVPVCTLGANLYGLLHAAYLAAAFPTQPLSDTGFLRPTVGVGGCTCQ